MFYKTVSRGLITAILTTMPLAALAADIVVSDPYARSSRPNAPTGAAFMMISNNGENADHLLSASSVAAKRVELHTHIDQGDGVLQMAELEDGIALPAGATHMMVRGGDHVMLMGLNEALVQGQEIIVTLTFKEAGDIVVMIPVDNERRPDHSAANHEQMDHDKTN